MCKQLLSILFPLNILGKKIVNKKYIIPIPRYPQTINIVWTGEALDVAYTNYSVHNPEYSTLPPQATQHRTRFVDGDQSSVGVYVMIKSDIYETVTIVNDTLYFKCTNVTSLIVNGETLI